MYDSSSTTAIPTGVRHIATPLREKAHRFASDSEALAAAQGLGMSAHPICENGAHYVELRGLPLICRVYYGGEAR